MTVPIVPQFIVTKYSVPVVYLDTNIMIEMSRSQQGRCTDAHREDIERLYEFLKEKMHNKKILCPLGAQINEMGLTNGRENARDFLYDFVNAELAEPETVKLTEYSVARDVYLADLMQQQIEPLPRNVNYDIKDYFEWTTFDCGQFILHATPKVSQEEAESYSKRKHKTVQTLNEMKSSGNVEHSFDEQLATELQSDAKLFAEHLGLMDAYRLEPEKFLDRLVDVAIAHEQVLEALQPLPSRNFDDIHRAAVIHGGFLLSPYHHKMPYVDIMCKLWAYRMQQGNKICQGDRMDTIWAAAYLPFVDYAITDKAFSGMLNKSGLATQYGTKVYYAGSISDFLADISTDLSSR